MKRFLILGIGVLLCVSFNSHAAQTAQARLFCLSVRFHQAMSANGEFTFDLTTLDPSVSPNGELAPSFLSPTHLSGFHEYDTLIDEAMDGFIEFDVPMAADVNNNGFADFFEVGQAVSATTTGDYDASPVDSGTVRAVWSRAAGSKDGTCILRLRSAMFGPLPDFVHAFEIIEYTGPLNYTAAATNVSGALNLTQTGDPSSQFTGPIGFIKSPTNRFDELNLQHSVWTNASSQTFHIGNDLDSFLRNAVLKTNYQGFVDFDDGDPNTADPDYYTWVLSIDDLNDSNGNGIPDFSDDVGSVNARPPSLTLTPGSANLSLSISGAVGRMHEVQQVTSLSDTNWTTVSSVTLTNDPQSVSLPLPSNANSFWRVRVL